MQGEFFSPLYPLVSAIVTWEFESIKKNILKLLCIQENELNEQYKKLDLSEEHRKIIALWINALQAQNSAYTAVVFRMGMQFCFSLLMQLANL